MIEIIKKLILPTVFFVSCTEIPERQEEYNLKRSDIVPLGYIEFNLKNKIVLDEQPTNTTTTILYNGIPYLINKEINISETFPINLESIIGDFDIIQSIILKILLINYIPIDMTTDFYTITDNNQVTDSFFHNGKIKIPAANVLLPEKKIIPVDTSITVTLERTQIDHLIVSDKLYFASTLTIKDELSNNSISLNDSSRIWIQISAKIETTKKVSSK